MSIMLNKNIKNLIEKMDNVTFSEKKQKTSPIKLSPKNSPKPVLTFHYDKDLEQPSSERLAELREQVINLSKIKQPEQRSQEWFTMRNNKITASDWAAALGKNPYSYRKSLLRSKCGEQKKFYGGHMQHGVKYEPVANMIYEYRNNVEIIEFGLLPHPSIDFLGASPDGITKDGIMVEIKCPPKREITGEPPIYYWIQVQGQLEVCELDRCDFLECKIEEYSLDEDYFNDNYKGNYFCNELGLEKGITILFYDKKTEGTVYVHSKLGMNRKEYIKWKDEEIKKAKENSMIYEETTYWKLTEVSCVPIYRDQSWFEGNLPDLRKFWDDVLHYREVGTEELQPKPRKKKVTNTENKIFINTEITDFSNDNKILNTIIDYNDTTRFRNKCFFNNTNNTNKSNKTVNRLDSESISSGDSSDEEYRMVNIDIKKSLFSQ